MSSLPFFPRLLLFWYIFIFISTYGLSIFHLIERPIILGLEIAFWGIMVALYRNKLKGLIISFPWRSKIMLLITFLAALLFIQGFFSAPSTTDSMVYHIPRVMYWIQEKTVFQDIIRSPHDFMAPFAEYVYLHLYIIAGGDRLLFLSQWLAYIGSVYLCYLIAKHLGIEEKASKLIILLTATIPIALMQAVSTQVDLVVTLFLLLSVYLSLIFTITPTITYALLLGSVLGLGIFTKATFMIYLVLPLGIIFHKFILAKELKLVFLSIITGMLMMVIPLPYFIQNIHLFGSPQGGYRWKDGSELIFTNEEVSLPVITSNLIRNTLVNFPFPVFSAETEKAVILVHKLLQLDINDKKSTCCGMTFNIKKIIYPQEDIVSSPIHLFLILLALFLGVKKLWGSKGQDLLSYIHILTIFTFILFSAVLKWQPYHPRLEPPFLLVGTITSVSLIYNTKIKALLKALTIASLTLCFLVVFLNVSRPFVSYKFFYGLVRQFSVPTAVVPEAFYIRPRMEQYFNSSYYWYQPYDRITSSLTDVMAGRQSFFKEQTISFDLIDNFEYPLWLLISQKTKVFKIIPLKQADQNTIIITTSNIPVQKEGYQSVCYRAEVINGYACLSKR